MEQPINQFDTTSKNNSVLLPVIIAVILTAIIAGGGIYWWANQKQTELNNEVVSLRTQVDQLKQVSAPPPTPGKDGTIKLTIDTLKNTEYYSLFLNKIIKLTNGLYSESPESRMASHCEAGIYKDKIALGDLNNDSKDDAAVILDETCGGSGSFRELSIIIDQNGKPYYLTSKDLGDRVIINSATIKAGVITLDMVIHGPNDGLCCPTLPKIFKYRLSGIQIIEVE